MKGINKVKISNYKDLEIWKQGIEIVDHIYVITQNYPKTEQYGLCSQMQRSAVSIPSNIAEGFSRYHTKEYIKYLYIALGSCAELETQVIISNRRKFIIEATFDKLQRMINQESKMIMGLIQSLKNHIPSS